MTALCNLVREARGLPLIDLAVIEHLARREKPASIGEVTAFIGQFGRGQAVSLCTRTIARLHSQGFIRRWNNEADRRTFMVEPTDTGRELALAIAIVFICSRPSKGKRA